MVPYTVASPVQGVFASLSLFTSPSPSHFSPPSHSVSLLPSPSLPLPPLFYLPPSPSPLLENLDRHRDRVQASSLVERPGTSGAKPVCQTGATRRVFTAHQVVPGRVFTLEGRVESLTGCKMEK